MMEAVRFGQPERFEIEVRLVEDREPRNRLPAHGGWSTGDLKLTVSGEVLTRNGRGDDERNYVRWYLLPFFEWLAGNWISLFHEENFVWKENSASPAATSIFMAMRRLIADTDNESQTEYAKVREWWSRHAVRAADSSGLYPDVHLRRLGDDIEISWTARQPAYAPDGFRFVLTPGIATLPVADVVRPLWEVLNWFAAASVPTMSPEDHAAMELLRGRLVELQNIHAQAFEEAYLSRHLLELVRRAKQKFHLLSESTRLAVAPALSYLDSPVLMFGGVSPDIGTADVETIIGFLLECAGGENPRLRDFVDAHIGAPVAAPFEEGYELAEEFLEKLDLDDRRFIDIREILRDLEIRVIERSLRTTSIRGAAVAGTGYSPAILVNITSPFNRTEPGKRFTLAHELFHILYDRSRAGRITHTSGPWASPGVEKRANAFAAMLLMPRDLVRMNLHSKDRVAIAEAARTMQVGVSALIEHLYNLNMLDELERDSLREEVAR